MCRALLTVSCVSKEKRASTSVDTLPGMILRISLPNSTSRRSRAWSTCSSMVLPCFRTSAFPFPLYNITAAETETHMLLAVRDGDVDEMGVLGLLGSGQDQGRVGGGIFRLVLADGCRCMLDTGSSLKRPSLKRHTRKVTRVADHDLYIPQVYAIVSNRFPEFPGIRPSVKNCKDGAVLTVPVAFNWSSEEAMVACVCD